MDGAAQKYSVMFKGAQAFQAPSIIFWISSCLVQTWLEIRGHKLPDSRCVCPSHIKL